MTDAPLKKSFARKYREVSDAASNLQSAMQQAFATILPRETSSRGIARRLSIDKMLGWQAQRIATAPDAATILSALPGDRGMALLIDALGHEVPSAAVVEEVRRADAALRGIFARDGASSREVLAIAAGGLDSKAQRRTLDRMLKVHFDSAVAIRGEVANAEVVTWIATPSRDDPSLVTLTNLYFVAGLRTIRPLGPRVIYRGISAASQVETSDWSLVDANAPVPLPLLVPEASTPDLDACEVEFKSTPRGGFVVADPDEHPSGTLTLGFADSIEGVGPIHRTEHDRTGELASQLAVPVKHFYLDVLFDMSLPPVEPNAALYFSAAQGIEHGEFAELRRFTGEVEGKFVRSPALPKSSGVDPEKHLALLEHGAQLVDRSLEDFRCFRMHIAYPPTYTRAVVRWLLPESEPADEAKA